MPKYRVFIDVDKNAGDDDVFLVSAIVEAPTPEEAKVLGEARAAKRYGEENILGAWEVRQLA